jgi:hypothetical protein
MTSYPPATSQEFCQNITTHLARPASPLPTQQPPPHPAVYQDANCLLTHLQHKQRVSNLNKPH